VNDDPLKNRVYYSQNREDLILEAFFPDVEKGFYVDVGASDPVKYSVTKLFYDKGWSGINLEPIKHHYRALKAQRPRDLNLNIGVGDKPATLKFFEYTGGDGLSTFSSEVANEYAHQEDFPFKDGKEYMVEVSTLKDVFKKHKVDHIHFIKIDVEGFEYDVLAGNDWDTYRPEVICIEANHITKDWRPLLKKNDYKLAFSDGLNEYYVDTKTQRLSKFDFVNNVVIRYDAGLSFSDYKLIAQQKEAVREAHLLLQSSLATHAHQSKLYNDLLSENHDHHARAVAAERALSNPMSFMKYQLKKTHRAALRKLGPKPPQDYVKEERRKMTAALNDLANAEKNEQLLASAKKVANTELERLERIYSAGKKQPVLFSLYGRFVNGVKRLRLKGIIK